LDSSFIERFGIWGMAGMVGLMVVLGVYGFVSLLGVDPQEALSPPAEEEVVSNGPDLPVPDRFVRERPTPVVLAETAPPAPTPADTAQPTPSSTPRVEVRADAGARAGAAVAPPAAPATPAPAPLAAPQLTPEPTPPLETSAPTPEPPVCSASAAELTEKNDKVRFSNATVAWYGGSALGVLVLDVGGTQISLLLASGTEVHGDLASATVVTGHGHRLNDGTIVAQVVDVVC
jgi:hypothetical protein